MGQREVVADPAYLREETLVVEWLTAAVAEGVISADRIDRSVRRILELKVRTRAARHPIISLDSLRQTVGAPPHWSVARDIATRAVTLLRDSATLIPAAREGRFAVVTYAPELDVNAGRAFAAELRALAPQTMATRIDPSTSSADRHTMTRSGASSLMWE